MRTFYGWHEDAEIINLGEHEDIGDVKEAYPVDIVWYFDTNSLKELITSATKALTD